MKKTLIFICIFCYTYCYSQYTAKTESVDLLIRNYLSDNKIPGLIACVVNNDTIIWSNSYGYSDIEDKDTMDIDKITIIASISKTITSTAIMRLWEKGLIDINVNINRYLPFSICNPNHINDSITIKQLLTHTSSIRDAGMTYSNSYTCGDPVMSLKDWIFNYFNPKGKLYNKEENFYSWAPGNGYKYSNIGFGVLGYIVEEVSGIPFNEYCRQNIFEPLGMKNTGWYLSEIDTSRCVTPYVFVDKDEDWGEWIYRLSKKKNVTQLPSDDNFPICQFGYYNYPDGSLRTCIKDLSRFLLTFMNGGNYNNTKILKKGTVERILSLQSDNNKKQGLCWFKLGESDIWGHSGYDHGIATQMYFSKGKDIGIIIFQNGELGDSYKLVKQLFEIFLIE